MGRPVCASWDNAMKHNSSAQRARTRYAEIAAIIACVVGATVIFGWLTRNEQLIQLSPTFAPMQFNTALGFLLCGIGLFAISRGASRTARTVGAMAGLIAALTLAEYVFGANLYIDELFVDAHITTKTSHPGRMAPNTALCFLLVALFLLDWPRVKLWSSGALFEEGIGFLVLALAAVPFIGYLQDVENAYGWGQLTRMAAHTALGFIVLSVGIIGYAWRIRSPQEVSVPLWAPTLIAFAVLLIDLYTPLGAAVGVAYVPLVFCGIWFARPYAAFVLAAFSSVLILLGVFASAESNAIMTTVLLNRSMAFLAVWVTAVLVFFQKRAQARFQASQRRLQLATEAGEIGVWEWDLETNQVIWDDRMYRLHDTQRTNRKIAYEDWSQSLHGDDRPTVEQNIADALSGKRAYHPQFRLLTKSGDVRYLEARGHVERDATGAPLKMFGVCWDTTEQKEAEFKLGKLIEELGDSNSELERFAYVASHDLQEPLRMVSNFTQLIADRYEDQLDKTGKQYIQIAGDAARRMQALVDDLLEYSRLENDPGRFGDVNLESILNHVKENLKDAVEASQAKITHDPLPVVIGNDVRLSRILQNLIGNAIKYQSPENQPTVHVSAELRTDDWLITISDNGIGISPDYLEKIFLPFKRLHRTQEYSGTGIGLAVSKKIVETQGGKMWATSTPDEGSQFYFTIPITMEREEHGNKHDEGERATS